MLSAILHPETFAFWMSIFASIHLWVTLVYEPADESKNKLLWQLPSHVICTTRALWKSSEFLLVENMFYAPQPDLLAQEYAFYYAYWTVVLCDFARIKHKDSDYRMVVLHHIVTWTALIASDLAGWRVVGVNVLFLHDVSDIGIALLKIGNKYNWKEVYLVVIYVSTMVVWCVARLALFGGYMCLFLAPSTIFLRGIVLSDILHMAPLYVLMACHVVWTHALIQVGRMRDATQRTQCYEGKGLRDKIAPQLHLF
jgi:hypothetical protein